MLKAKSFKKENWKILKHAEGGMMDIHMIHVAHKLASSFGIKVEYIEEFIPYL